MTVCPGGAVPGKGYAEAAFRFLMLMVDFASISMIFRPIISTSGGATELPMNRPLRPSTPLETP